VALSLTPSLMMDQTVELRVLRRLLEYQAFRPDSRGTVGGFEIGKGHYSKEYRKGDHFPYSSHDDFAATPEDKEASMKDVFGEEDDEMVKTLDRFVKKINQDVSLARDMGGKRRDNSSLGRSMLVTMSPSGAVAEGPISHRKGISPIPRLYSQGPSGAPIGTGNANQVNKTGMLRRTGTLGWAGPRWLPPKLSDVIEIDEDPETFEVEYLESEDSEV